MVNITAASVAEWNRIAGALQLNVQQPQKHVPPFRCPHASHACTAGQFTVVIGKASICTLQCGKELRTCQRDLIMTSGFNLTLCRASRLNSHNIIVLSAVQPVARESVSNLLEVHGTRINATK